MSLSKTAISAEEASRLLLTLAWSTFCGNANIRSAVDAGKKHASFPTKWISNRTIRNFIAAARQLKYQVRVYENKEGDQTITLRWK